MALLGSALKHVLIMGGRDGMAAREILKWPMVEHIDLVEIDLEITRTPFLSGAHYTHQ